MKNQLSWGIIGHGNASKNFLDSFDNNLSSKISAVASKSNYNYLKEKNFLVFKEYEDILKSKDIDIIYISIVNSLHKKLIDLCIDNNKHILVEKPSSLKYSELNSSIEKIKSKNIFFKESILYLSHPIKNKILNIIQNNDIGNITNINSSYGFNFVKKKFFFFKNKKKYNLNIFKKNLGGGAIYNFAHYPLSAINTFSMKKKPLKVHKMKAKSLIGFTNVDEFSSLEIIFNDGLQTNIQVALNKNLKSFIEIKGEKGSVFVDNPWVPQNSFKIKLKNNNKGEKIYDFNANRNMWSYEIESIEKNIFENSFQSNLLGAKWEDSLWYLKLIDQWKSESINENI